MTHDPAFGEKHRTGPEPRRDDESVRRFLAGDNRRRAASTPEAIPGAVVRSGSDGTIETSARITRLQRLLSDEVEASERYAAKSANQEWMLRELQAIVADCPRCGPLWHDSGLEITDGEA